MNKAASIIITLGLIVGIGIILMGNFTNGPAQNNVEIKNEIQYIKITARGGYSPQTTIAQAGIPTKLIMKTNGVYDCSTSLVIRSIGYQKILPQTGETEIDIGIPKVGEPLQGICGMGMYNFLINFN